jgi:hypothetical protein
VGKRNGTFRDTPPRIPQELGKRNGTFRDMPPRIPQELGKGAGRLEIRPHDHTKKWAREQGF